MIISQAKKILMVISQTQEIDSNFCPKEVKCGLRLGHEPTREISSRPCPYQKAQLSNKARLFFAPKQS